MEEFDFKKIPNTNFVFDFKMPNGFLPLGYTKNTIGINILNKLNKESEPFTAYYSSIHNPSNYELIRTSIFSLFFVEHFPNSKFLITNSIKEINPSELYFVIIESLSFNNLFETYSDENINLSELFSPKLLNLIKNNENFKIVFIDVREGAYPHDIYLLQKINNFLIKNNINHKNKVLVSTNNNFITNLKNKKEFQEFKNKINVYCNDYLCLTAGRFISELQIQNNKFTENGYNFSIQTELNIKPKEKYFLMYNRNSERPHRAYFVNELYKNNLINKGIISFFENSYLDLFLENSTEYVPLNLNNNDIISIRENYKNFTPLIIDNANAEEVADYHNFLSRKDEYEKTYFTIISETNAESEYCFITEKTMKPIMNLHPFVVLGNPHTLKVLKSYGFKTFDKWWDESYDDEFDFKKRANMVLDIVKKLCSYSFSEWEFILKEMEETLFYNKKLLQKMSRNKFYHKKFINNFIPKQTLI